MRPEGNFSLYSSVPLVRALDVRVLFLQHSLSAHLYLDPNPNPNYTSVISKRNKSVKRIFFCSLVNICRHSRI